LLGVVCDEGSNFVRLFLQTVIENDEDAAEIESMKKFTYRVFFLLTNKFFIIRFVLFG
jgi:hypothetical protein